MTVSRENFEECFGCVHWKPASLLRMHVEHDPGGKLHGSNCTVSEACIVIAGANTRHVQFPCGNVSALCSATQKITQYNGLIHR